jgi:tetratricopeptide (TPR) repeat protein
MPGKLKRRAKRNDPPPSASRVAALAALESEAKVYAKDAADYRKTLTNVVKHHYEERRRRLVTHLDKEIVIEKEQLTVARKEAVKRLEDFVKRYSGPYAHPEATPDAMFRLAALFEERARSDTSASLEKELVPAINLYRRIIREFPTYKEVAGVHYYLGHAYTDAGLLEEGQQAWRSLVCSNHFSVQEDPNNSAKILLQPLPQDHDDKFWEEWYGKNPLPLDQLEGVPGGRRPGKPDPALELVFQNPYEGCEAVPQEVKPQQEPRYVAEVWWQLGNYHFDQLDVGAGPYALNRAAASYELGMELKKPPLYGVAMYKRAWTYYKQQRYREAVKWFVELLRYADEQEKETGDPGADFRAEAYTYIAGSLTHTDFDGPPRNDPFIPRADVFDEISDPVQQEEHLRIAIARVQDPALIPQDQRWTVEIYKALAQEFTDITQSRNAIATLELTLKNFPLDRDAPAMQDRVADLYDELARLAPEGSAVSKEAAEQALAARTKLADYVGNSAWTRKNQDDPEAIDRAERLVRRGLQRAAADHTNSARAHVARSKQLTDPRAQSEATAQAIREYQLAAKGWAGYIEQDPNAIDAYESRFWLADARFWAVTLQIDAGENPEQKAIDQAVRAAEEVRDSNEDDEYLQPAAYYLVVIADKVLDGRHNAFETSGGATGLARQEEVSFEGEGDERKPLRLSVPREVSFAVKARDDYNQTIDPVDDPQKNGLLYAFQAADFYFVYGQFDEAKGRFAEIYQEYCGANEWGYRAWEKLVSMSNFQGDAAQSRALVDSQSCAFDEETRAAEEAIRTPVRQGVAYLDARKLYDEAEQLKEGPQRDAKWREAAAAYKVALDAAPERDEAPEAAMNGAYAYKQVGDYDKAIEMYELFISRYGNDEKLTQLRQGDPSATPPVQANPAKYENRAKFLKMAYDALANAYVLFFDYPKAAKTFESIAANGHFTQDDRRAAAQQSMNLSASLGDTAAMSQSRDAFARLGASNRDLAEADFVAASAALKQWDALSPDKGANALARQRAESAMKKYYESREKDPDATEFLVEAAYWMAKMKRSAKDAQEVQWWQRSITAFIRMRSNAPVNEQGNNSALGSRAANMAAEGAFAMLDDQIRSRFDYETGHHRFRGTPQQVLEAYQKAALEAKSWYDQLQGIVDQYGSPEWGTAAIARQGSLYDSLRSGLYNTRAPELIMFDKKTEDLLRRAEESDSMELQEKADAVRTRVETAWQEQRDRELASADQVAVDRYGAAVVLARRYNVNNAAVVRAIRRMAFLTDVVGEQKLSTYASRVNDLNYSEGMFLRLRPGVVTLPEVQLIPPPAPEAGGAQ